MNQMTIDLREVERRIADTEQRISQTEALLVRKQNTRQTIESMELSDTAELLRLALIGEYDNGINNLETYLADLRAMYAQLRAMKFGVFG